VHFGHGSFKSDTSAKAAVKGIEELVRGQPVPLFKAVIAHLVPKRPFLEIG